MSPEQTVETLVASYIYAKDGNRPHLMARAFARDAHLQMQVRTGSISFPPDTQGLAAISHVLVRQFGQTYDNVYTFCLQRPTEQALTQGFHCKWLVVMTEKASGQVRAGSGTYDWTFSMGAEARTKHLVIAIEQMQIFVPELQSALLNWASQLPYPFCSVHDVLAQPPQLAELAPVLDYLKD